MILRFFRTVFIVMLTGIFILPTDPLLSADSEEKVEKAEKSDKVVKKDEEEAEAEEVSDESEKTVFTRMYSSYEKPPPGNRQPWKLVRALQHLQDDIVTGKPRAQDAYKILLVKSNTWMSELDDETWQYERNLDAAAVFVMIGGGTAIAFKALRKTTLGEPSKILLKAAIAYAEKDVETAFSLMEKINIETLPPSIAAQFALAKSMTISGTDLPAAKKLLMKARQIAPGTLIEEASLRREIRIAGQMREFDDFAKLSKAYLRRFRNSRYFNDFVRNLGFAVIRMNPENDQQILNLLDEITSGFDDRQLISVAMYVAQDTVVSRRKALTDWSLMKMEDKIVPGTRLDKRRLLYDAASNVADINRTAEILNTASEIDVTQLQKSDQEILKSLTIVGSRILQEAYLPQEKTEADESQSLADSDDMSMEKKMAMIDEELANNPVLSRGSDLLKEIETITSGN